MARPRSEERRGAIITAAISVLACQGLGAPTALIAKRAGVSNGSLFTYFATKADLMNSLYVDLKVESAAAALGGLPIQGDTREQMHLVWFHWLYWATSNPEKRRALAHLSVSDDITPDSLRAGRQAFAGVATLLDRSRANGPMRDRPIGLVVALTTGVAEAAMDVMTRDPANAAAYCEDAFGAVWRMIT